MSRMSNGHHRHEPTMNRLAILVVAATAVSLPVSALAKCVVRDNAGKSIEYQNLTFPAFTPAVFDPDVPDGTILYKRSGSPSGGYASADCSPRVVGEREYAGVGTYNATYKTYPTPVSGVGYRIKGGSLKKDWWPVTEQYSASIMPLAPGEQFELELVKTGPITATGTLSGLVGTTTFNDHEKQVVRQVAFTGGLPIKPTVPTCKIKQTVIGVPMGFVTLLTLNKEGASPYKPFSIDLTCSGGTTGTSTRMYITLSDATTPGNRGGLLSLSSTGSGAAEGVAIEIRRLDDSIVSYGHDSAASGNPNQWFIGQFGNVDVSIPLKARYVKTAPAVKPGEANAKATFTMSYQ
jgi:type 1 fimbria pilin